jgi:hypothetical protein
MSKPAQPIQVDCVNVMATPTAQSRYPQLMLDRMAQHLDQVTTLRTVDNVKL